MAYPKVAEDFLAYLQGLREASAPLTLVTIRGLLVAHLQHSTPEIFTTPFRDGSFFTCSDTFVRKFIKRALGWSWRRSTRAGQKIPKNADSILKKAALRMAYVIKHEDIPSALIVNSDQTQVVLQQGCNMTYAPIGSKQVTTLGSDEKRAITVLTSVTANGQLLPFQTIYKGSTALSLPKKNCRDMSEARAAGFLFESSHSDTYWSTQATMRNFVTMTLVPYFMAVKLQLGLPFIQCAIWLIDC